MALVERICALGVERNRRPPSSFIAVHCRGMDTIMYELPPASCLRSPSFDWQVFGRLLSLLMHPSWLVTISRQRHWLLWRSSDQWMMELVSIMVALHGFS